jgi:hypothetical protein
MSLLLPFGTFLARLLLLCSYPFEILDDALVLKKMLEHEEMQQRVAGAAAAAAAGTLSRRQDEGGGAAANMVCGVPSHVSCVCYEELRSQSLP